MKRFFALMLAVCLIAALLPATALAAGELYVGGVKMEDGKYLANGATTVSAEKPAGGYAYYKDGVLTLNNYAYEEIGHEYEFTYTVDGTPQTAEGYAAIYADQSLTIELIGQNSLKNTYKAGNGIHIDGANALTISGAGSLSVTCKLTSISSGGDITISETTLKAISDTFGIVAADALTIDNAVVNSKAGDLALASNEGDLCIRGAATNVVASENQTGNDAGAIVSWERDLKIEEPLEILDPAGGKPDKFTTKFSDSSEYVTYTTILNGGSVAVDVHIAAPAEPVPETGDGMDLYVFAGLALLALIGMAAMRKRAHV